MRYETLIGLTIPVAFVRPEAIFARRYRKRCRWACV